MQVRSPQPTLPPTATKSHLLLTPHRIRHVKCDEAKPHCRRCLSTGRTCDGYSSPRRCHSTITHPSADSHALTALPGTPSEQHSFNFFHSHTSPQLRGLFSSPFWSQHVLQASLREEAIWHAAVALGALHGVFADAETGGQEFAVRQYIKAISCLTRLGVERRVDVTLIACLLFTCFESLRGHHSPALLHLDNGINLLLELQSDSSPKPGVAVPTYPTAPYTPLLALRALLTHLDTQAAQLIPARRKRLRPSPVPSRNYTFTSLEEAQRASDELWNYCLYTLQPSAASQHPSPHPSRTDLAHLQSRYTTALSTFLHSHPTRTPRERKASALLRLHALVAALSLSPASVSLSEEAWSAHTADFAAILSLARSIMEDDSDTAGGVGRVGLDTGVLGPLYLVALRCREGVMRRGAVELLGRGGREGLWDSGLLARVAGRVVGIEEDGGGGCGGGKEGRERVADVDVVFDPEGCRAGVRFLMEGSGVAV